VPKVYIPNCSSKHDFSPAKKFGQLVCVSQGGISPLNTGHIHRLWEMALENSSKKDYILICSLNILCSIGASMFTAKHGRVNYLLFHPRKNKYEPRTHKLME
jgi:hypothetical protein